MADIRPFAAIHYARKPGLELSELVAPPYDVLDERGKAELQERHPRNIVNIDLPHLPPKTVGPDETYERAAATLTDWLNEGTLIQDPRPATYPYMQTYEHLGRTFKRHGFFTLVRLSPFGQGDVIPHELTYQAAIEDRLKLMRATGVQLSPIFGLYSDPRNDITNRLFGQLGRPELSAMLDGVKHDLWSVIDAEVENDVIGRIGRKPIYIADGHHRYTTALQYKHEMEMQNGGPLPEAHPANWCLFVLVGMQDPGLIILPTHRLIGGLDYFSAEDFRQAIAEHFETSITTMSGEVGEYARKVLPRKPPHTFGFFDGTSRKLYELRLRNLDVLADIVPDKSEPWRRLDVAICQHYLIERVLKPLFAGGNDPIRAYTADPDEIAARTDGVRSQVAILLQETPLQALEQLGAAGEVMPQKSTFFFPKLATGMVINPLR